MSNNVAIIQARLGSKRFPKKMLSRLQGKSLIEWVIIRLSYSKSLDKIILATSTEKDNDELVDKIKSYNISIYRGSEYDVLDRFISAAKKFNVKNIIRVCADNPFIDPLEIDRLINFYNKSNFDYVCNHRNFLGNNYADGFGAEIFSTSLLSKVSQMTNSSSDREHVTKYILNNLKKFNVHAIKPPVSLSYPDLKFDVDYPADLYKLEQLATRGVSFDTKASEIIKIALNSNL